jgi:hypothetical protein
VTTALLAVVPLLYLAAVAARPEAPVMAELPAPLAGDAPAGRLLLEADDLFDRVPITVRLRAGDDGDGRILELTPRAPLAEPEALAYYSGEPSGAGLPPAAVLLGAMDGTRPRTFPLPAAAAGGGWIVIYALGHQEVVATAELPAVTEGTEP